MLGAEAIIPCIGPLSTSLEGIKLFMSTVLAAKPWTSVHGLVPLQWNYPSPDYSKGKKIKIAVMLDDGVVRPHPPVARALEELVAKLAKNDKFEVVEWNPYKHDLGWKTVVRNFPPS
jgi:amidase